MKPREYKLKRNAIKRMTYLQCGHPDRAFWVAPTQNFKWAVYTKCREVLAGDPNNIAVSA